VNGERGGVMIYGALSRSTASLNRHFTKRIWLRIGIIFVLVVLLITSINSSYLVVRANTSGNVVYTPTSHNEALAYARMIRLQHSGSENGTLLATFEHWSTDGTPVPFIILQSKDDGRTWSKLAEVWDGESGDGHPWSHMWQPFLFEFPRAIGKYPAGTLLLVGNVVPSDYSATHFQLWRSLDHGRTWKYVDTIQTGGTFGNGIWEPFLILDSKGRLICFFSDERDSSNHSQFIGHIVSVDGGDTWSRNVVKDVASPVQPDRPGMPVVTRLPDGKYVMAFEVCGRANCEIRIKYSNDGYRWDPKNLGTLVETTDGRYLGHSPYIVWSKGGGQNGQLILAAQRVYQTVSHDPAPEDYRAMFVSTDLGKSWHWAPTPFEVQHDSPDCNANYSPALLPSEDGSSIRLMAPASIGDSGPCSIRTYSANAGVLPYRDNFVNENDSGWNTYGGCWSVSNGIYYETCGGTEGNKSLAGSTGWSDYLLKADVKLTSDRVNAGVLVRVTNPHVGADSHNGYYIGLDPTDSTVLLGRQNYAYVQLERVPVRGGVEVGVWYTLQVSVRRNKISVSVFPAGSNSKVASFTYTDHTNAFPNGMIGVRDFAGTAAFRSIYVQSLP